MLWTDIWGVCQEPNQLVGVGWEAQYGVESWVGWGSRVRQKEGKEGGGRGDDTREWGERQEKCAGQLLPGPKPWMRRQVGWR